MFGIDWEELGSVFEEDPEVIAAWVFGSAQEGVVRPAGDLDIGVLFASRPSLVERAKLVRRLEEALRVGEIDMAVLNGASPILRFEALSGRAVFCRDPDRRAEFASLTGREYEDEMALLRNGMEIHAQGMGDCISAGSSHRQKALDGPGQG